VACSSGFSARRTPIGSARTCGMECQTASGGQPSGIADAERAVMRQPRLAKCAQERTSSDVASSHTPSPPPSVRRIPSKHRGSPMGGLDFGGPAVMEPVGSVDRRLCVATFRWVCPVLKPRSSSPLGPLRGVIRITHHEATGLMIPLTSCLDDFPDSCAYATSQQFAAWCVRDRFSPAKNRGRAGELTPRLVICLAERPRHYVAPSCRRQCACPTGATGTLSASS
jgi:hypothetical protein